MFESKIILASASPRRAELLKMAGVAFEIHSSDIEEIIDPNLSHSQMVIALSQQKAKAVQQTHQDKIILAADTIVVLENNILGKPESLNHAKEMLDALSGKKHLVMTGVTICQDSKTESFCDQTEVFFNKINKDQIDYYVDNYKPLDKAGAYAIQEYIGAVGIEKIVGDYYNVVGLPVRRVVACLNEKFID